MFASYTESAVAVSAFIRILPFIDTPLDPFELLCVID